jgi:hypothetical protein
VSREDRLAELVQRQRLVILFAQEAYNEVWSRNLELRETILELKQRLLDAGLSSGTSPTTPSTDPAQLVLPFQEEHLKSYYHVG